MGSKENGYAVTHKWEKLPSDPENLNVLTEKLGYVMEELSQEKTQEEFFAKDDMAAVLSYLMYIEYFSLEAITQERYGIKNTNNTFHPWVVSGDLLHDSSLVWLWVLLAIMGSMVL